MTIEAELFDGTVLEFPDGTDPQVIQKVVKAQTAQRKQAAPTATAATEAAPAAPAEPGWMDTAGGYAASLFDGVRQGTAMVAGAPVDLMNNAPRLLNILPGVEGVGPMTDNPIGGRDTIDLLLRGGGLVSDYEPRSGGERIVNRVGEEIGASVVPTVGAIGRASAVAPQAVNRMVTAPRSVGEGIAGMFLKPAQVDPAGLMRREAAYAAGAGAGAGIANEVAGENQGVVSDLLGSLLGTGAIATFNGLLGGAKNLYAGATGNPAYMDNVAGEVVADRLVDNSTQMQQQFARTGNVDTDQLVSALRRPAAVEDAVPGYRADIGDRTLDPGLSTFARNANGVSPGARTERLVANNTAVAERMSGLAPDGDASRLRVDLQSGVDRQIADALTAQDAARVGFDDAAQAVQPGMPDATARGSAMRSALADSYSTAQRGVDAKYATVDQSSAMVDPAPFRDAMARVDGTLPLNDRLRFRPSEADTVSSIKPSAQAGAALPKGTGFEGWVDSFFTPEARSSGSKMVNEGVAFRGVSPQEFANAQAEGAFRANGNGVFVEPDPSRYVGGGAYGAKKQGAIIEFDVTGLPARSMTGGMGTGDTTGFDAIPMDRVRRVWEWDAARGEHVLAFDAAENADKIPYREVASLRSGLTDDIRRMQPAGEARAASVRGDYVSALDEAADAALPADLRAALSDARAARRDVGDRFERPGTALESILAKREGGGYALDDSAVGPRLTPPDQGRVTDFGAAWREAGTDPRFREGLMDEVKSQVVSKGLLDKPDALGKFLSERQIVLADFPELRANLERAGVAKADLVKAERAAAETQKRLTTPGRSAPATYLKYGPEASGDAIRAVISDPKPVDAAKELLTTANTPTARADLRAALWEEVKRKGVASADDATGQRRWNGKALRSLFEDPKFSAVAEELWSDNPQDLTDIKTVFGALASAEGSGRTVVGSGTAQSLAGKFDPALSTSSVASRVRSVNRGQLSPTIAVVDVVSTWLRGKSAQVQARAIDQITAAVVNNPGLAADLLQKYNPADAAARRAMLTQKYGMRIGSLLNVLDEAENEDPVLDAVQEDR